MTVRRTLILIAALASLAAPVAACGEGASPDAAPPGSEPQPEPPPGPVGPPVAAAASLPFAGGWASSRANCSGENMVWIVRADGVETPGETSCRWNPADVKSAGTDAYTVAASCSAENPPEPATLTLRGDGQNLTIEGAPFEPIPLVRCTGAEG